MCRNLFNQPKPIAYNFTGFWGFGGFGVLGFWGFGVGEEVSNIWLARGRLEFDRIRF